MVVPCPLYPKICFVSISIDDFSFDSKIITYNLALNFFLFIVQVPLKHYFFGKNPFEFWQSISTLKPWVILFVLYIISVYSGVSHLVVVYVVSLLTVLWCPCAVEFLLIVYLLITCGCPNTHILGILPRWLLVRCVLPYPLHGTSSILPQIFAQIWYVSPHIISPWAVKYKPHTLASST